MLYPRLDTRFARLQEPSDHYLEKHEVKLERDLGALSLDEPNQLYRPTEPQDIDDTNDPIPDRVAELLTKSVRMRMNKVQNRQHVVW